MLHCQIVSARHGLDRRANHWMIYRLRHPLPQKEDAQVATAQTVNVFSTCGDGYGGGGHKRALVLRGADSPRSQTYNGAWGDGAGQGRATFRDCLPLASGAGSCSTAMPEF